MRGDGDSGRAGAPASACLAAVSITLALLFTLTASSAFATFPGKNGKIAFSTVSGSGLQVETIEPDGTGRTTLTSGGEPVWSADGERLAFSLETYGSQPGSSTSQILAINADGSGRTVIAETCGGGCKAFVGAPSWSPDGSRLAHQFTICGPSECNTFLSMASVDGTSGGGFSSSVGGGGPDWSPDGSLIAFSTPLVPAPYSDCYPNTCYPDIAVVSPDGSGRKLLTSDPATDGSPSWSPDGSRIAFSSDRDGNPEIYVMNADGTGQTRLTSDSAIDAGPVWSPDGSKIAFTSFYRASHPSTGDVYVMNPDGTGLTNLTNTTDVSEGGPDWQPIPGPQRSDYKNAAHYCKALRDFLGVAAFRNRFGGGANAYGKCVSGDGR